MFPSTMRTDSARIGKRAPSDYMSEVCRALSADGFRRLLHTHMLPADDDGPLWRDDVESFLAWRRASFATRVAEVTGGMVITAGDV